MTSDGTQPPMCAASSSVVRRVCARRDALMVVGGPGTGKTTTLVACVVELVGSGVPLNEIVVFTHARFAAQRLRQAIMAAIGTTQVGPRISTAHGWCLALVGQYTAPGAPPARLMSAPEQEFRVRELIGATNWPASLGEAPSAPAFAGQLRALIARGRQLGLDPADLARAGWSCQRPEWVAAARFFEDYLDVIDAEGVLDYAELVHRARLLLSQPDVAAGMAGRTKAVLVDEFAECDESVVALLRDIWRTGVPVSVFADPTTRVFDFRGAWPASRSRFPQEFAGAGGPATVIELTKPYRLADKVEAWLADQPGDEAALVAQRFWQDRATGASWSDMAVIGQTAGPSLQRLARGLAGAGIPVKLEEEAGGLADNPAVTVLVKALEFVVALATGRAGDADWQRVLCSPLVGLDEIDLRRAKRLVAPGQDGDLVSSLLLPAVSPAVDPPGDIAAILAKMTKAVAQLQALADAIEQTSAAELAWGLWQLGDWPDQLRRRSVAHSSMAPSADRDLDAVIAFFDLAQTQGRGAAGVAALVSLVGQQVVQKDRSRETGDPVGVVTVLSAYRAKGRQWPVVAVVGAVEGAWPLRSVPVSLLAPERLQADGQTPPATRGELVAAQRRLFRLATSRSSHHLVVVGAPTSDDEPAVASRFLAEMKIAVQPWHNTGSQPPHSQAELVGQLRAVALAPDQSPALVDAAVGLLSQLRCLQDSDGHPLAPAADPRRWWWAGMGPHPAEPGGKLVSLAAGDVGLILTCPRRWFLQRRAGAAPVPGEAATFGLVAHRLFERFGAPGTPVQVRSAELDEALALARPSEHGVRQPAALWRAEVQRHHLEAALARFTAWRDGRPNRTLVATEVGFHQLWNTPSGDVEVTGRVDRLEADQDGHLVVIDFKTATSANVGAYQDQLAIYQLAARRGAFDEVAGDLALVAPPELVWPTIGPRRADIGCRVDTLEAAMADEDLLRRVGQAATIASGSRFDASGGPGCRSCVFMAGCPAVNVGGGNDADAITDA